MTSRHPTSLSFFWRKIAALCIITNAGRNRTYNKQMEDEQAYGDYYPETTESESPDLPKDPPPPPAAADEGESAVKSAWPSRTFMVATGALTVALLIAITVVAVLLSNLLKERHSGTGAPPPCNDKTNPCKDKDQFCNAEGRCVPSIVACDTTTAARCGGSKYCYADDQQNKKFCYCLRADGSADKWDANEDASKTKTCTPAPENQTVVDAYRAAGGADGDDIDGIKNYVAWDEVTGRWGLRFRAKAAAAGWDESKDAIPLLHTKDPQKGPDAGFCVSHLPASALDEPDFFKCKPGQVCGAYKNADGKDANGCIDRPAPPNPDSGKGEGGYMVWWTWLLIALGVVTVPVVIGVFVTVILPKLKNKSHKTT